MKKALALTLALVLALSMAVSAFGLVVLDKVPAADSKLPVVKVVDLPTEKYLYADKAGTYYIALDDKDYEDVKVTANGILTAELVKYDPEKMVVEGMDIKYAVTEKGEVAQSGLTYEAAKAEAANLNNTHKVTYYGYELETNVNIIKVVIAENYTVAYQTGTLKVEANVKENGVKVPYAATLKVISDVTIFEYEMVKWAADTKDAALECGSKGYSDFVTANDGYDFGDDKYDVEELRDADDAAVVSTTAFRAIAGKNLTVECDGLTVTLKEIKAGQKGVNFKHEDVHVVDKNEDGIAEAIAFEFYGDQVIAGDYTITADLGYDWFTLREAFGVKVEEDDIISYYVLKNGKVVSEIKVDYMTADIYEDVVLTLNGSNSALGAYEVVLNVPAVEGETNPNTGAESVVGVVAALAVVSVATAAAVSLKK